MRHRLDVHAAFRGDDHRHAAGRSVDEQREIELLVDVGAVRDVQAVDLLAVLAGLDGDERVAEHVGGRRADILLAPGEPLPRPPAWICDFTTYSGPGSFFEASTASSTLIAAKPAGTGTPNLASSSLA